MDIAIDIHLVLPEELPVDALELSIVFANALENAIQAVKELPDDQRHIICKSVKYPRFIMEIANPYAGEIVFDRRGIPTTNRPEHGIGTRSIVAFAEKYNALYLFRAEGGWFKVRVAV
nr:GHKL domain-containing protein [uncultured Oscillibacter sp.]